MQESAAEDSTVVSGCSGAVERVLGKMEGVQSFDVNLETQKVTVVGTVTQEEVGGTAAFLASPLASGITGQVIYVDAGYCITGM